MLFLSSLAQLPLSEVEGSPTGEVATCSTGPGIGECSSPQGVAVSDKTGVVYVADSGNDRIDAIGPGGKFSSFGEADLQTWVAIDNNPTSPSYGDLYTSSLGYEVRKLKPDGDEIEALGSRGAGPCRLARTNDPVAIGPGGQVDLADSIEVAPEVFESRIERWDARGGCLGDIPLFRPFKARNFAVDSRGDFFVTIEGAGGEIREYNPRGNLLRRLGEESTSEGLAIGPHGELFAKQTGLQVSKSGLVQFFAEYDSSGRLLKRFGYLPSPVFLVQGMAARTTPEGQVYASEEETGVRYLTVPPGPAAVAEPCRARQRGLTSSEASLVAEVDPEGRATTVHFEFGSGTESKTTPPIELGGGAAGFGLQEATASVHGLEPGTEYHCTIVAANGEGPPVSGETGSFETP